MYQKKKKKKGETHSYDPHAALKRSLRLASSVIHPKFTTSVMLEKVNMDNVYKCIQGWTSTLNTLAKTISKQGEYLSQTFCTSLLLGRTLCTRTHTAFANQHTSNGERKKERKKKKHPKHYVNCHLVNLRETEQIHIWQQHHKGKFMTMFKCSHF